jgi:hypothetical protein
VFVLFCGKLILTRILFMSINFQILNPLNDLSWNEVEPASTFYSAEWAGVISGTYGYKPLYFVMKDDDRILSYIPIMEAENIFIGKKAVSLPFSDICEPFARTKEDFQNLFDFVKEYGRKNHWKSIELRGGKDFLDSQKTQSMYFEHLLDLSDSLDTIYGNLRDNVKRNIKKSQKSGIEIEFDKSANSLNEFIRLNKITRKRHGLPSQPKKFFYNIYNKVILKNSGIIISARINGKTIASNVYLMSGDNVTYKYGASDYKFQSLRPNNLLMWESIRYFKEKNFKVFSFGRTFPENKGLMEFKSGWSHNVRLVHYYKYNLKKDTYETDLNPEKSYINVFFRNLPIFVSSIIGAIFYKYFI